MGMIFTNSGAFFRSDASYHVGNPFVLTLSARGTQFAESSGIVYMLDRVPLDL